LHSIDFGNISFFHIQLCLSIEDHASFTRAAAACHVTQPTLSKRVSEIENQLGILLFIRGKNTNVRPSQAGKVILKEWRSILTQMELSLQKGYSAQANLGPVIVIGTAPSSDDDLYLTPMINSYIEQRADAEFRFSYGGGPCHADGLINGEIDVAFFPIFRRSLFERHPIKSVQILSCDWLVGMLPESPLANQDTISFGDLRLNKFIMPSPQLFGGFYSIVEMMCINHGFSPQISFFTKNHMSLSANVRSPDEVFLVDNFSQLLNDSNFVFKKLIGVESGIIMAYNVDNPKPIVQNFQRFAKSFFRDSHQ